MFMATTYFVLLFSSDAASRLQAFYPKMVRMSLAWSVHYGRQNGIVDDFQKLSQTQKKKKLFLKAPSRTDLFQTEAPGIPLHPSDISTRRGTRICASILLLRPRTDY